MGTLIRLIFRNLRIYLHTPWALVLTFAPILIFLITYPLFISGEHLSVVREYATDLHDAKWLGATWIAAALPVAISYTAAMGALGVMVLDRRPDRELDFALTPLRSGIRAGGYVLYTLIVTVLAGELAYVLAQAVTGIVHGTPFDGRELLYGFGYTALGALQAGACGLFAVSVFRSVSAYAVLAAATGTLTGFLSGVFVPVGMFPEAIANIIRVYPGSHIVAILRQTLTGRAVEKVFADAGAADLSAYQSYFGLDTMFGNQTVGAMWSLTYVGIVIIVLTGCAFYLLAGRKKRYI